MGLWTLCGAHFVVGRMAASGPQRRSRVRPRTTVIKGNADSKITVTVGT